MPNIIFWFFFLSLFNYLFILKTPLLSGKIQQLCSTHGCLSALMALPGGLPEARTLVPLVGQD